VKELRTLACILSLATLTLFVYGAFAPSGAALASPAVQITHPNPGALVQGNVTVSVAYRSASGAKITDLELYVDKARYTSVKLATPATEGTYTFVWNTAGLPAGVHTLTAIAYDAQGNPGDVAVSVYVDPQSSGMDLQAPTVKLSSPASGSVVRGIVTLIANALDNAKVNMVLFQLNGRLLFATNHPPYRYDLDTTKYPNGPHTIKVYAYDASDNCGESTPVVINVDNPSGRTLPNERPSQLAGSTANIAKAPAPTGKPVTAPSSEPQPSVEMARKGIPQLPTVPAASTSPQAAARTTSPVVARPQPSVASRYPDLVVPRSQMARSNALAAPTSSVTPNATPRPVASAPTAPKPSVMMTDAARPSGSRTFAMARAHQDTTPSMELRHVASPTVGTTTPRVGPSLTVSGSAADSTPSGASALGTTDFAASGTRDSAPAMAARTQPMVAAASPAPGDVTLSNMAASRQDAPSFASADQRPAAPNAALLPLVDPARTMPELVATVASLPCSILFPGAESSRLDEPAADTAASAQSVAPVAVDAGAPVTQVVAIATDGTIAHLGSAALGTVPTRITEPNGAVMPVLSPGTTAPAATRIAARPASTSVAPTAVAPRTTMPAGSTSQPAVSTPGTDGSGVMMVLMDKRTRRAVPLAVIQPQASEPSAQAAPAAHSRKAPRKQLVVAPKSGQPVSIVYNGKPVRFQEVDPFINAGMTLAPFRHIMEMEGGVVLWNNLIKQVQATTDGRRIQFTIGNAEALVNDQPVQMDVAPFLKQGRAIVPVSFLRDALDVVVEYDPQTGRVTIAAK
jgi:hypothetical protein